MLSKVFPLSFNTLGKDDVGETKEEMKHSEREDALTK